MNNDGVGLVIVLAVLLIIWLIRVKQKLKKLTAQLVLVSDRLSEKTKVAGELLENNTRLEHELEAKKIENLKFVLNPHSVRNTLNTIHGLADRTYRSVIDLSGIFDYMLYESQQPEVTLEQEMKFVTRYIDLYISGLMRHVRLDLDLELYDSEKFAESHMIAPLITAHFVENAFKHGDFDSDDSFFMAHLKQVGEHEIVFIVQNKLRPMGYSKGKGGLGIRKMEERLGLLYKARYDIEYKAENDKFTAQFKLQLNAV